MIKKYVENIPFKSTIFSNEKTKKIMSANKL